MFYRHSECQQCIITWLFANQNIKTFTIEHSTDSKCKCVNSRPQSIERGEKWLRSYTSAMDIVISNIWYPLILSLVARWVSENRIKGRISEIQKQRNRQFPCENTIEHRYFRIEIRSQQKCSSVDNRQNRLINIWSVCFTSYCFNSWKQCRVFDSQVRLCIENRTLET